jgi:hypothetical protein
LLDIPNVVLTANSTTTLSSSSAGTRKLISAAIEQLGENASNTVRMPETGHYVSQVGESRIVWTRAADTDHILVLSIFVPRHRRSHGAAAKN